MKYETCALFNSLSYLVRVLKWYKNLWITHAIYIYIYKSVQPEQNKINRSAQVTEYVFKAFELNFQSSYNFELNVIFPSFSIFPYLYFWFRFVLDFFIDSLTRIIDSFGQKIFKVIISCLLRVLIINKYPIHKAFVCLFEEVV